MCRDTLCIVFFTPAIPLSMLSHGLLLRHSGLLAVHNVLVLQVGSCVLQALLPHHRLRALDLSRTCITASGLKQLGHFSCLTDLRLSSCTALRGGLDSLQALPLLQHMTLAKSAAVSPCAVLNAASTLSHLTFLDLSWCCGPQVPVLLEHAQPAGLQSLQVLNLCNASVPPSTLAAFSKLGALQQLDLAAHALGSAPQKSRRRVTGSENGAIVANAVDGNAMDAPEDTTKSGTMLARLASLTQLTCLSLRWCNVRCLPHSCETHCKVHQL